MNSQSQTRPEAQPTEGGELVHVCGVHVHVQGCEAHPEDCRAFCGYEWDADEDLTWDDSDSDGCVVCEQMACASYLDNECPCGQCERGRELARNSALERIKARPGSRDGP